ncbi:MAG: hypothetical protein R6T90_09355 [Dissulfuribacterales bacterium]
MLYRIIPPRIPGLPSKASAYWQAHGFQGLKLKKVESQKALNQKFLNADQIHRKVYSPELVQKMQSTSAIIA